MKDTGGYLPQILLGMASRKTQSLKSGIVALLLVLGLSTSKTLFTNLTEVWELEMAGGFSFLKGYCIAQVRIAVVPMDGRLGCTKLKS
jgi:membrane-associated HD superfamily phosphohydrolase